MILCEKQRLLAILTCEGQILFYSLDDKELKRKHETNQKLGQMFLSNDGDSLLFTSENLSLFSLNLDTFEATSVLKLEAEPSTLCL